MPENPEDWTTPNAAAGGRVVRVMGELNFGGTEIRVAELIPRLAAEEMEVHVVTLSDRIGSGPLAEVVRRHGGSVVPLALDAGFSMRFSQILRKLKPSVVHVDCANFSGFVLCLAALHGVPVRVAHFRGDDNQRRSIGRRVVRRILRRMLKFSATDILGVSEGSLTYGFDASWRSDIRCKVVLNGLDLNRLLKPGICDLRDLIGVGPNDLLCVTVGRGAPEKRWWLLPPILAALQGLGVDAHVAIIGPGQPGEVLRVRKAASMHGVADRVHLIGPRDDVGWLLRQADVVVHPSCLEGLPGGVLEPVALGIGTVAANLPGVRFVEMNLMGVTVVDVGASPDHWAAAVLAAAQHTSNSDRTAAIGRFAQSVFSIDEAVAKHLRIYRQLGS